MMTNPDRSLPDEKLAALREQVHARLADEGMRQRIQQLSTEAPDSRGRILQLLDDCGLVNEVVESLRLDENDFEPTLQCQTERASVAPGRAESVSSRIADVLKANAESNKRHLVIALSGGRAFLDELTESDTFGESARESACAMLTVHIHFAGQRKASRPTLVACDPIFDDVLLFDIPSRDSNGQMADAGQLLSLNETVFVCVTRTEHTSDTQQRTRLVASASFDWRTTLSRTQSQVRQTVSLTGTHSLSTLPFGLLDLTCVVSPALALPLSTDALAAQLDLERASHSDSERLFLSYARQWWRDFLSIRPSHSSRLVKVFARSHSALALPVSSFVRPIALNRLIDTPRMAARFVSLIPLERTESVGGDSKQEEWLDTRAFVSARRGDIEEHAILLCGLLLGFGLQAFVSVGTKKHASDGTEKAHYWVTTVGGPNEIVFWDPVTGSRLVHCASDCAADDDSAADLPYLTLSLLFNHLAFFANIQPSNRVSHCDFSLYNSRKWKAMSTEALQSVSSHSQSFSIPLSPPTLNGHVLADQLETDLKQALRSHRASHSLDTQWDDRLSFLLTPALSSYEFERTHGVSSIGNEEFQQAIKGHVKDGHTFKAFPIQFVHCDPQRIIAVCRKSVAFDEIALQRGDQVRLALRCAVTVFPEDVVAVWVMFAVCYRSVL